MKKALLLDTSIGTSNVGDNIIMECVEKELAPILANMFVFHLPTQVSIWWHACSRFSQLCDLAKLVCRSKLCDLRL